MKEFDVILEESNTLKYTVRADTEEEAIERVCRIYKANEWESDDYNLLSVDSQFGGFEIIGCDKFE